MRVIILFNDLYEKHHCLKVYLRVKVGALMLLVCKQTISFIPIMS